MPQRVPVRRALISVTDKSDLVPFAQGLASLGAEIISTGGTAAALRQAGIDVIPIDRVTGFPEMMGGRVKSLHPAIHGAVLARREDPEHVRALQEHDITPIDLVCVNLYPFEKTILQDGITDEQAVEQIDIGGPAMLRSAAKNHAWVTVVTAPDQYDRVISTLRTNDGASTYELRRDLAAVAFMRTAEYDTAISAWMATRRPEAFPTMLRLTYAHHADLRYGENPHQSAAVYSNPASPEPSVVSARVLHGKALSYNNLHDGAAALQLIQDLDQVSGGAACAAIIKHANPCGAAVADDLTAAFTGAYEGDPLAAYGGILAVNKPVSRAAADAMCDGQKFLEVIIAPRFDDAALARLSGRWKNVRLLAVGEIARRPPAPRPPGAGRRMDYKSIPGGMLVQERDTLTAQIEKWQHAAGPKPDQRTLNDAAFVWTVVKHLKSNAVAIGRGGRLLGAGMGQVDRMRACRLAVERAAGGSPGAAHRLIAASDAFFPFPDGPQSLIDSGVRCIVQPGGSIRDQETIDLCESSGVTCLLTGIRHFRH